MLYKNMYDYCKRDVSMTLMTMFMSQQIIGICCVIKLLLLEQAQSRPSL